MANLHQNHDRWLYLWMKFLSLFRSNLFHFPKWYWYMQHRKERWGSQIILWGLIMDTASRACKVGELILTPVQEQWTPEHLKWTMEKWSDEAWIAWFVHLVLLQEQSGSSANSSLGFWSTIANSFNWDVLDLLLSRLMHLGIGGSNTMEVPALSYSDWSEGNRLLHICENTRFTSDISFFYGWSFLTGLSLTGMPTMHLQAAQAVCLTSLHAYILY